ncbi:MAG: hypothetical protein AAF726_11435 [Planctomycetota bacterium]
MVQFGFDINATQYENMQSRLTQLAFELKNEMGSEDYFDGLLRDRMVALSGGALITLVASYYELSYAQRMRQESIATSGPEPVEDSVVRRSIETLVEAMGEDPAPTDPQETAHDHSGSWQVRNLGSFFRAIWRKWCNVPPFCSETDEDTDDGVQSYADGSA